jgi:hypothetical protein
MCTVCSQPYGILVRLSSEKIGALDGPEGVRGYDATTPFEQITLTGYNELQS